MNPPKKWSSAKPGKREGQVTGQFLPIHFRGNFRFEKTGTAMWKLGRVPSCWNNLSFEPSSSKVRKRKSSNMFIYSTSLTEHSVKKKNPEHCCFNRYRTSDCPLWLPAITACGLLIRHIPFARQPPTLFLMPEHRHLAFCTWDATSHNCSVSATSGKTWKLKPFHFKTWL
jgi:hypothetical protein